MLGMVFALLSAFSFSLNVVTIRRGVAGASSSLGVTITVLLASLVQDVDGKRLDNVTIVLVTPSEPIVDLVSFVQATDCDSLHRSGTPLALE